MTKIKTLVSDLVKKHNLTTTPVDVEGLANAIGATIKRDDFDEDLAGFAYHKGGRKYIGVNNGDGETRQRFTIAHEIGHLLLHDDEDLSYDKSFVMFRDLRSTDGNDEKEVEANRFAAELLMPEGMVLDDARAFGRLDLMHQDLDTSEFIKYMASKYGVSPQAMLVRLTTLYFTPVIS